MAMMPHRRLIATRSRLRMLSLILLARAALTFLLMRATRVRATEAGATCCVSTVSVAGDVV